jgi:hypothetical protein
MIKEFICPNGRMSINGVCPLFEGDDGQIKDFNKPKTEDIQKEKGFFEFDFEKPTASSKKSAKNILTDNVNYYNNFVEDTLGIPSNIQNTVRIGTAGINLMSGSGIIGVVAPFAIPFMAGAALKNQAQKEQQAAINRESVRDLQGRIDKGQFGSNTPTPQDKARTDYGGSRSGGSKGSIGSRGEGMSGYGGGADRD